MSISGSVLKEKAQRCADKLGHNGFWASNGWLSRFKKKNKVSFKKVRGESASVDDVIWEEWKRKT